MARYPTRNLFAQPFVPTSSHMGREGDFILRGENMWIQTNRVGATYATCYRGSPAMGYLSLEPADFLTGTVTWSSFSRGISGSGTSFLDELHLGMMLYLGDDGSDNYEYVVIESIESDTAATLTRFPTTSGGPGAYAVFMPVIWTLGTKIASARRGNAVQFPKGHILGVGAGEMKINGLSLNSSFTLDRTPRFALYDPSAGTYTQKNVGITLPDSTSNTMISLSTSILAPRISGTIGSITVNASTSTEITFSYSHNWTAKDTITFQRITGDMAEVNGTWSVLTAPTGTSILISLDTTGNTYNNTGGTQYSPMRLGDYNIRVCASNTETLGFSNPSDVIPPINVAASTRCIKVTFMADMATGQNAWDIYGTEFADYAATNIEARYMGPWYFIERVTETQLGSRSAGTSWDVIYSDAEINASTQILTFDNFAPVNAEFVDLINGIPIYMSCLGKGNSNNLTGSSPGPAAVPSKPSNPEAVFLDKAITTAGGDIIMGSFNTKGRLFALCQNSLQQVILTSLDFEPVTFRSLWDSGFRNPYNACFVKEYLYAFSTQKVIRSVAGGDDSVIEFDFASDIRDYIVDWDAGYTYVAYDPKNRAVIFFYSAYEARNEYEVTLALPFRLDTQIWNPPMVIANQFQDQVVSGVATVGENLYFVAGGMGHPTKTVTVTNLEFGGNLVTCDKTHNLTVGDFVRLTDCGSGSSHRVVTSLNTTTTFTVDGGTFGAVSLGSNPRVDRWEVDVYKFDAGDSRTKNWHLAWNFTDNGDDERPKIIKGLSATGRFTSASTEIVGIDPNGEIDLTVLEDGGSGPTWSMGTNANLQRLRRQFMDAGPYSLWTARVSGSNTDGLDRFDELVVAFEENNSNT